MRAAGISLLGVAILIGCLGQRTSGRGTDVPAVLRAAFLDVRTDLVPGRVIVVGPFKLGADAQPRVWDSRDLAQVLADTSVRLGRAVVRGQTLEGHPLPWAPDAGEVGVSFSDPQFNGDTASVLVSVVAPRGQWLSSAMNRLTLVRRPRGWTVARREQLSTT